ncbi:serine hydrolase domain-containing protein [Streptomyces sp. NPDC005408]|uniref:serine hydrolase domain-containing protein n=1 Tax=Streptomyces sp. NPDC005408 TaxID=3155341 RepID=UPI0033A57A75
MRRSTPYRRLKAGAGRHPVPNGAQITIRELLNHSSGIPNYEDNPKYLAPYLAGDVAHVTTPQQLVALGTALKPAFAPGTSAAYSNTNYTVAGLSRRRDSEALQRRVLQVKCRGGVP